MLFGMVAGYPAYSLCDGSNGSSYWNPPPPESLLPQPLLPIPAEEPSGRECADRRSNFCVRVDFTRKYDPFPFGAIKEAASEKLRVQCFFQIPAG